MVRWSNVASVIAVTVSDISVSRYLRRREMMVKPTGTGFPSAVGGKRCVRFTLWPPNWTTSDRTSPNESSQSMAAALFRARMLTSSGSLRPSLEVIVSLMNVRTLSSIPFALCFGVSTPLMPDVAFAEFPPRFFSLSRMMTSAPWRLASIAADRPARPPPTTITRRLALDSSPIE